MLAAITAITIRNIQRWLCQLNELFAAALSRKTKTAPLLLNFNCSNSILRFSLRSPLSQSECLLFSPTQFRQSTKGTIFHSSQHPSRTGQRLAVDVLVATQAKSLINCHLNSCAAQCNAVLRRLFTPTQRVSI